MSDSYDGIILGTGHNSLVLQAYLSRCGLRILSLDRAPTPGGGLSTIENPRFPGIRHNPHSFYHRGINRMPWYRDLEMEQHGVSYLEPELNVAMILADGSSLQWWTDPEKTYDSFARISRRDGDALRHWMKEFRPIVEQILIPESQAPPLPPETRNRLLKGSQLGRRLLEISAMSPLEFVMEHFENDVIRAGLLFFNGLREVDLRLRGFGHVIPALLASPAKAQMCVGGSAGLASGLVSDIDDHDGEIRCGVEISEILVERGRAIGVELSCGEQIFADKFIASGLNPQQTFLELLPESRVSAELRKKASAFRYNLIAPLFGLHLALREAPRYTAAGNDPELQDAFMLIFGLDHVDQFSDIVEAHQKSVIPETVAWGSCPTRFDSSQASEGRHSAFLWEKLPYHLHGDPANWRSERDRHGNALLKFWQGYAPNLDGANVLDSFSLSPVDTVRTLPNMYEGDLLVGSFENDQVGFHRPFPGAGTYRTPLEGLYLCGGSTHPGGNITGLCGYNASSVIAADLKLNQWWESPDIEQVLADPIQ